MSAVWSLTGESGHGDCAVRLPSLTLMRHEPDQCRRPVGGHFSLADYYQSARLWALDQACSPGGIMQRREFITLVGGAAASLPLTARAQQPERMARIGVMLAFSASDPEAKPFVAALKKGLQDLGWIEGRNIEFDFRWPAADPDRIRAYAAELVDTKPSVILVNSTTATTALQQETLTVPVVFKTARRANHF
jgi:ABC transporter substrate binding protein